MDFGFLNGLFPPNGMAGPGAQGVSPMDAMTSGGPQQAQMPDMTGFQPTPQLQAPKQGLLAGLTPDKLNKAGAALGGNIGGQPPPPPPQQQLQDIPLPQMGGGMDPMQFLKRRG